MCSHFLTTLFTMILIDSNERLALFINVLETVENQNMEATSEKNVYFRIYLETLASKCCLFLISGEYLEKSALLRPSA